MNFETSLGVCIWLMSQSDYHKNWTMRNVDLEIIAPLLHNQVKIYFDDDQNPVGLESWAWIGDEQKQRILDDKGTLAFKEWNSGEHLLFHDYIAPWGHAKAILKDLKTHVFPDDIAFSLGRNTDGSIRKIYHWKGVNVNNKIFQK
ncbi:toxin-activating lysine-acyltransferase [Marinomonas sp. 2405UD68-3]|uniref:toxin-activating lysine-acyltransferase n=1 Tax=Marinomonas sp. 2405UD68-3 TaxID=3391835 RepID=UPI0039C92C5E